MFSLLNQWILLGLCTFTATVLVRSDLQTPNDSKKYTTQIAPQQRRWFTNAGYLELAAQPAGDWIVWRVSLPASSYEMSSSQSAWIDLLFRWLLWLEPLLGSAVYLRVSPSNPYCICVLQEVKAYCNRSVSFQGLPESLEWIASWAEEPFCRMAS